MKLDVVLPRLAWLAATLGLLLLILPAAQAIVQDPAGTGQAVTTLNSPLLHRFYLPLVLRGCRTARWHVDLPWIGHDALMSPLALPTGE